MQHKGARPYNLRKTRQLNVVLGRMTIRMIAACQKRDTQPLGSPGYAAPEQYGRAQTTPQADIYSLSALLHYLLSGQDPADHPSGLSPLRLNGQPGSAELEELVSRMLLPTPLERPASAHAVAWKLSRIRQQVDAWEPERIWKPPVPQAYPAFGGPQIQLPRTQTTVQAPPVIHEEGADAALVGFIVGVISLVVGLIPFWGIVPALIGIVVSSYGLVSITRKKLAIAGLVMCCVAAVITLASCAGGWFL